MVGGTTAKLGGGQFSGGVYAAGLSEAMMPQFKNGLVKLKDQMGKNMWTQNVYSKSLFIFGYATNEISGKSGQKRGLCLLYGS